jgi:hypothetical protein
VNEGTAILGVELNDWGTNDPEAIAASISGPADFEPFLAAGNAVLASSLFCTVWDASSQTRIDTASVSLARSGYAPVTESINGVYGFPALPSGSYALLVDADGFASASVPVVLADATLLSVTVPLEVSDTVKGTGCRAQQYASKRLHTADIFLALVLGIALLISSCLGSHRAN